VTTTHISNQSKHELEDQQRKIRLWLKPANLDNEQRRRQKEHVKHTNAWFLAHPSFQNWLEGTTRLLWTIGKPGCGKSILASSIVAQLQNQGLQPIYFYFNSKLGTRLDAGPLGLIRSFLVQIMTIDSELVHTLHTLYQRQCAQ
jgi:DNA replication protein DnaC